VPIGTTLFLDGGEVTEDPHELEPFVLQPLGLHWAAGAGISAKLGQLKVRLDVGYRLNRTDESQAEEGLLKNTAFHFGVGDAF
jgi:hypothetical protein